MTKNLLALFVLSLSVGIGCGKRTDDFKKSITRPAAAVQPGVESQANSIGANITWEETSIDETGETEVKLTHKLTVNGQKVVFSQVVSSLAGLCNNSSGMGYDASMLPSDSNRFAAIGHSACWDGDKFYLGLSLMAWTQSQALTQQFVLLNLTDVSVLQINKQIASTTTFGNLAQWIEYQFTSY